MSLSLRELVSVVLLASPILTCPASAQEKRHPLEPVDRSSPRATLTGFIDACNDVYQDLQQQEHGINKTPDYERRVDALLRCLDLSGQPEYLRESVGQEAAVCLKEVLDRIELPADTDVPDADTVKVAAQTESLDRWTIPHTEISIARMAEGAQQGEYLFSRETVSRAVIYFRRVQHLPYRTEGHQTSPGFYKWFLSEPSSPTFAALVHKLPAWTEQRVYGQAIWQWAALLLTTAFGLLAMVLTYTFGRRVAGRTRETSVLRYAFTLLFPLSALLIPWLAGKAIEEQLAITGLTLVVSKFAVDLVFLLALVVVVVGTGSRIGEVVIAHPRIQPQGLDAQFIRVVCRLLSFVAAIIVLLEGGRYLGIPLATLVASAGVTGLAIALAAQDILKSIFASMMILLDKPYRCGDRIIVGDVDGHVEEIGLRSTKIRLLTGHVATIPNEEMARTHIENVGRRQHIRRTTDLHIPLDTPREKVEKAVMLIREVLADHEGMDAAFPPRVYFDEFNPDSFNLKITYWYHPPNYWDFLAFSERINLAIFRAFEEQGVQFSLPFKVTYTTADAEQKPLELRMITDREPDSE